LIKVQHPVGMFAAKMTRMYRPFQTALVY